MNLRSHRGAEIRKEIGALNSVSLDLGQFPRFSTDAKEVQTMVAELTAMFGRPGLFGASSSVLFVLFHGEARSCG